MNNELQKVLDICLKRISSGESVERCLADYPQYRHQLEPLLKTANVVTSMPKVTPSPEFRRLSQNRLVESLRREANAKGKSTPGKHGWQALFNNPYLRPLVPVTLVLILVLTVTLSFLTRQNTKIEAAAISLSILSGEVEIQMNSSSNWQPGNDGQVLNAGSQVKTLADSYAVLTFVDGSTTKLEPGTELSISASDLENQVTTSIALQQKVGKTWNYIQPANNSTEFSIKTPSSVISAHGTAFITDVGSSGITTVAAVEGSVNVFAHEAQVSLTKQQTQIKPDSAPQPPEPLATAGDRLTVSVGAKAIGSIIDPYGSSTGYLPSGISFNQITGSINNLFSSGQQIELNQPLAGTYKIIVHCLGQEVIPIDIQLSTGGQAPFNYSDNLDPALATVWSIQIDLSNGPPDSRAIKAEPGGDQEIEHVIETALALARVKPFVQPLISGPESTSSSTAASVVTSSPALLTSTKTGTASVSPTTSEIEKPSINPNIPTVNIDAPEQVAINSEFTASIDVNRLSLFDAGNYDINFDPAVLKLVGVISGNIGGTEIPVVGINEIKPGVCRVLQNLPGLVGVSGSGTLAVLQFHVIGGQTSKIEISNGILVDTQEIIIDVNWVGASVSVSNEGD